MDVKDVRNSKAVPDLNNQKNTGNPKRVNVASLTTVSVQSLQISANAVKVDGGAKANPRVDLRSKLNEVINVSNVANEATSQIDKLINSISGIVEQAKTDGISPQRREVLEKEANELVAEIKRTAFTSAQNGVRPLAGDQIRLEVEEKIGKTLDLLLPDDATEAFGLGKITFTTKDAIISTIVSVEAAHQSILRLRDAVEETSKNIREAASKVDVAIQNTEAAEASIRDLDEALKVASDTRAVISNDPAKALISVGDFKSGALGLLE